MITTAGPTPAWDTITETTPPPPEVTVQPDATWPSIRKAEWVWVGAMTLLILLLTQIPPTVERIFGPSDRVHLGSYWYGTDFSQYLAAMREATAVESWLVHNHFSSEPHAPIFMYPLYVVLGKLAAASGAGLLPLYALAEITMRVILPASLYVFVASFFAPAATAVGYSAARNARRFAFVLAAFSGGLSIWLGLGEALLTTESGTTGGRAANMFVETVTFGTFMAAPHVGLGLALTLLAVTTFAAACRGARAALPFLALSILLLAVLHPFNLPVLLGTCGVFAVVQSARQRQLDRKAMVATGVAGMVGAPIVLYNFLTFTLAPFWSQTYGTQNVMPSPRPWELPLDYGLVLLVAPLGLLALRRGATLEQRLLVTWLVVGSICMYLPVPYQRRFIFGLQPVLAVLATLGWPWLRAVALRLGTWLRIPTRRRDAFARRLIDYPLVALGFATPIAAFVAIIVSAATNAPVPLYLLDRDTYQVGEWIAARTGFDDTTAGSFNTGNVLAGVVPGRVVLGYVVATLHARSKQETITQLYRGELSAAEARAFLHDNRIAYLIVGPEERKLGAFDPGVALGLPVAVRIGEAVAYQFPGNVSTLREPER